MQGELRRTSKESAEHYLWGDGCDGWHLLKRDDVSVIQERVPPHKSETAHIHKVSRQFFFILEGEATIAFEMRKIILTKHQGIEIAPGTPHQFCNESSADVSFLVISVPKSHGDRYDVGAVG
jgi:mannose-6-phosphate isomerase-like protein (cupin superfamily)